MHEMKNMNVWKNEQINKRMEWYGKERNGKEWSGMERNGRNGTD